MTITDTTINEAVEDFLEYLQSIKCLSQNTIAAYRKDLEHMTDLLPIDGGKEANLKVVTAEDVRSCIGWLSHEKRAPASINRFISAVRTFFAYCRKCNYVDVNVTADIKGIKQPKRLAKFLTGSEMDALCSAPVRNELLWETRDKAILEMLYSSGCRVSELCALKLSDMSSDASSAIIVGKGGKERVVYFEKDARAAFKAYIADRKKMFAEKGKTDNVAEVFINQQCTRLTRNGVAYILSRYSGDEGTHHHISPHTMRHTFATAMMLNGADVRIVQELLGHSNISTTQIYTHITADQLVDTYNMAHPHGGKG